MADEEWVRDDVDRVETEAGPENTCSVASETMQVWEALHIASQLVVVCERPDIVADHVHAVCDSALEPVDGILEIGRAHV